MAINNGACDDCLPWRAYGYRKRADQETNDEPYNMPHKNICVEQAYMTCTHICLTRSERESSINLRLSQLYHAYALGVVLLL